MAATKTAKQAAKAAKKTAKPVAKKALTVPAVKKTVTKAATPVAKKSAAKVATPAAKKAVAKVATPAAKKAVAKVATPVAKKAAGKGATPAAKKAAGKGATPVAKKTAGKGATPVAKKAAGKVATPVAKKAAGKGATPAAKKTAAKVATPAAKKAVAKVATPAAKKTATKVATPAAKKAVAKVAVKKMVAPDAGKPSAKLVKATGQPNKKSSGTAVSVAQAGVSPQHKGEAGNQVASASPVVVETARPASPATSPGGHKAPVSKSKQSGIPVSVSKTAAKTVSKTAAPAKPSAVRPVGKVAVAVTSPVRTNKAAPQYKVVDYVTDDATGRPLLPAGYKPSADEEYMNPLQQEYFRQRLITWRAELVEESKQTIENLRDEVRDIGDEAERATRETENSLELRTRDRYRKLIGKIDSTLKRLDAGDYGYCVDTGEEIGLDRLEARLTAERTIDAQERWEHLQKQQGD